jgi:hypothetical protein
MITLDNKHRTLGCTFWNILYDGEPIADLQHPDGPHAVWYVTVWSATSNVIVSREYFATKAAALAHAATLKAAETVGV